LGGRQQQAAFQSQHPEEFGRRRVNLRRRHMFNKFAADDDIKTVVPNRKVAGKAAERLLVARLVQRGAAVRERNPGRSVHTPG